jgi:hypothetical protein
MASFMASDRHAIRKAVSSHRLSVAESRNLDLRTARMPGRTQQPTMTAYVGWVSRSPSRHAGPRRLTKKGGGID